MRVNTKLHLCIPFREFIRFKHGHMLERAFPFKEGEALEVFIITLLMRFIIFPFMVELFLQLLIFKEIWRSLSAGFISFLKVCL